MELRKMIAWNCHENCGLGMQLERLSLIDGFLYRKKHELDHLPLTQRTNRTSVLQQLLC
jgi:hypothetical protein